MAENDENIQRELSEIQSVLKEQEQVLKKNADFIRTAKVVGVIFPVLFVAFFGVTLNQIPKKAQESAERVIEGEVEKHIISYEKEAQVIIENLEKKQQNIAIIPFIESGLVLAPSQRDQWDLAKAETTDRFFTQRVAFDYDFVQAPQVVVALTRFNFFGDTKSKIQVSAPPDKIDSKGFTLVFHTWDEGRVHSAQVSWIAYGE